MLPSLDHYLHVKNIRDRSIRSRNIDDQKILQSELKRGTTGHTQPKVVISDAAFPWWLTSCKKLRYHLIPCRDIDNDDNFAKNLHTKNLRDCRIPSRDTDDQRILQSDWAWGATGHAQPKKGTLRCYLSLIVVFMRKI